MGDRYYIQTMGGDGRSRAQAANPLEQTREWPELDDRWHRYSKDHREDRYDEESFP
jgi:hypothetical protein